MPTPTWDTLRELAGFRSRRGCATSLYLDLDPSTTPTAADAETRLRALLAQAEKEQDGSAYDHEQKAALRADVERIRAWWRSEFDRGGARGFAVFASSADDLWRTLPLVAPVPDRLCVGPELYVTPLVQLVGRDDGALVAVVGRERGQVFRLRGGRLEELVDESEEQPGQHDQGGWSQARYQRHIEKLVRDHLKAVGGALDRSLRRDRGPELVIVAPEEIRGELAAKLSTDSRDAIVGWAEAEAHAGPSELLDVVRPVLDHARATAEQEALARWREELGRGGRAVAGWAQTLELAFDRRAETLLVDPSRRREVHVCPGCGRAFADSGSCPVDGARLEPRADGVDLAAHYVLESGGTVLALPGEELGEHDGIGALLRF